MDGVKSNFEFGEGKVPCELRPGVGTKKNVVGVFSLVA